MSDGAARWIGAAAGAGCAAFVALIVWASARASVVDGFRDLLDDPWGIVTLVDVYAGLIVAAAVVWTLEPRRALRPVWAIALLALGNVATLAFIAYYLGWVRPALRRAR